MADEGEWFHCARCGHFFRGAIGQRCPACLASPVVTEKELAFLQASRAREATVARRPSSDEARPGSSRKRKSRQGGGLMKFVIGWVGFLVGVVALGYYLNRPGKVEETGGKDYGEELAQGQDNAKAYEQCAALVTSFLAQTTPEQRSKLVYDPVETLRKMSRTGGLTLRLAESDAWQIERFTPLQIDGMVAYESEVSFSDGRRAEFVFLQDEEGQWRIDWAQLVRYSEHLWQLFLAGNTADTGEFRLLARRRAVAAGQVGDATSLVFFAPDPWYPERLGTRSPPVDLRPNSPEVRMLDRHFERRDKELGCFDSLLTREDPVSMVRVRVRLRRFPPEEEGDDPRIEVEELLACHWMSVADPGIDLGLDNQAAPEPAVPAE